METSNDNFTNLLNGVLGDNDEIRFEIDQCGCKRILNLPNKYASLNETSEGKQSEENMLRTPKTSTKDCKTLR